MGKCPFNMRLLQIRAVLTLSVHFYIENYNARLTFTFIVHFRLPPNMTSIFYFQIYINDSDLSIFM